MRSIVLLFIASRLLANVGVAAGAPVADQRIRQTAADSQQRRQAEAEFRLLVPKAQQLESDGKLADAIALWEQAVVLLRPVVGDTSEPMAKLNERLAGLHEKAENWLAARKARQEVVAIRGRLYGDKDWRVTDARLAVQDVEIRGRLTPHERSELAEAERVMLKVRISDRLGTADAAIPLAARAWATRLRLLGSEHRRTVGSASWLALLYTSTGNYSKAEPLYRQTLAIQKKVLGEDHPETARSLNNLAQMYRFMGDREKAEPLYRQAIRISERTLGKEDPNTAGFLNNLASLYQSTGQYAQAEALYQRALEINKNALPELHPDTATFMDNLAELYRSKGDFAKAEPLYRRVLEIREIVSGKDHPDTARSLNDLALLYKLTGDFARAERLYRQALEVRTRALGELHPGTAESHNNLALLYQSTGDYAQAEASCRHALDIAQKLLDQTLGGFAERQQLTFMASQQFYLNNYLSVAPAAGVRDAFAYGYVLKTKGAVTARQSLIRAECRRPELKGLFQDLQAVSTRLANTARANPDSKHPEARLRAIEQLTEQKEALEAKLAARSGDFAQIREAARLSPEQQLQRLESALPARTALVDVLEYRHISPSAVQKGRLEFERRLVAFVVSSANGPTGGEVKRVELGATKEVSAAVESWRGATLNHARSSTNGLEFLRKLKTLIWDKIEPHLRGVETVLVSPDGPLCQFALGVLPGSKPGTYLVEKREFVITPIPRLLPELLAQPGNASSAVKSQTPLLIGDVDFDSPAGPQPVELVQSDTADASLVHRSAVRGSGRGMIFPRLPGTAGEIQEIAALYRSAAGREPRLISGRAATEEAFRRESPRHRWLHIATHGFFAPAAVRSALDRPVEEHGEPTGALFGSANAVGGYHPGLLSGIVFAGGNAKAQSPQAPAINPAAEPDEGILTALEVAELDLSAVDLVTLSACETGLGQVAGGEGVLGLQRAFQLAGARTCVASLWKVDDAATQALMTEFYRNLWQKKLGKLAALRQAQLRMLHEYDPKQKKFVSRGLDIPADNPAGPERGSPFYWAGFVLSGDWR